MATSGELRGHPAATPARERTREYRRLGTRPTGSALTTTLARDQDQSLSSKHTNHREVGPLQAVAMGPTEVVVFNALRLLA
jgi:hypothetical protein